MKNVVHPAYFSNSSFNKFLDLLSQTSVEQLDLHFPSSLPEINPSQPLSKSVKILRLSSQLFLLDASCQFQLSQNSSN